METDAARVESMAAQEDPRVRAFCTILFVYIHIKILTIPLLPRTHIYKCTMCDTDRRVPVLYRGAPAQAHRPQVYARYRFPRGPHPRHCKGGQVGGFSFMIRLWEKASLHRGKFIVEEL